MATITLKKVIRKLEQAAFMTTIDAEGKRIDIRIPFADYSNLRQVAVEMGVEEIYVGGFTRYDYETPTGLLSDGEYGEDGFTDEGPVFQVIIEGTMIIVPRSQIVEHRLDLTRPDVVRQLSRGNKLR